MIIEVDNDAKIAIEKVCDIALKAAGNQVYPLVQKIYETMRLGNFPMTTK